jgi:hypothetical protein
MCLILAPHIPRAFWLFFLKPLTVLTRKQDKSVRATNKYVYEWIVILKTKIFVDWVGAEIPHC